jgi:hypothetical protein
MGASAQFARSNPRQAWNRAGQFVTRPDALGREAAQKPTAAPGEHRWLVDVEALARCRALFAGRASAPAATQGSVRPRQPILMDVPPAFDAFCHTHFAAVKRVHPELTWEDACPAYAIALSAHASLHVALDEAREQQLEQCWHDIRGQSGLSWKQARPLISDGCSALDRLDPLAIRR